MGGTIATNARHMMMKRTDLKDEILRYLWVRPCLRSCGCLLPILVIAIFSESKASEKEHRRHSNHASVKNDKSLGTFW